MNPYILAALIALAVIGLAMMFAPFLGRLRRRAERALRRRNGT